MAGSTPTYQLTITDDEGQPTSVPMVREEFTVGRKDGNVIRLTERNVSRVHARIVRENGRFFVVDLGSYNGTRVNGRRVRGKVPLSPGDEIGVGDYSLRVEVVEPTAVSMPPPPPPDLPRAPRITVVIDGRPGDVYQLTDVPQVVGRGDEATIRIDDDSVSRVHARLALLQGRYFVEDVGSANGIVVSGRRVRSKALEPGDVIEAGRVHLYFTLGALSPADIAPPRPVKAAAAPSRLPMILGIAGALVVAAGVVVLLVGRGRGKGEGGGPGTPREPTLTASAAGETGGTAGADASTPVVSASGDTHAAAPASAEPAPGPDAEPLGVPDASGPSAAEALAAARVAADKASTADDWSAVLEILDAGSLQADPDAAALRATAVRERDARAALDEAFAALDRGAPWEAVPRLAAVAPDTRSARGAADAWAKVIDSGRLAGRRKYVDDLRRIVDALAAVLAPPPEVGRGRDELVAALRRIETPDAGTGLPPLVAAGDAFVRVAPPRDAGVEARSVTPPGASAEGAFDQARQMVLANNHTGCIDILERAPQTSKNMELLITCFKAAGRMPEALDAMERYLIRYPSGRKAGDYCDVLTSAGRTCP